MGERPCRPRAASRQGSGDWGLGQNVLDPEPSHPSLYSCSHKKGRRSRDASLSSTSITLLAPRSDLGAAPCSPSPRGLCIQQTQTDSCTHAHAAHTRMLHTHTCCTRMLHTHACCTHTHAPGLLAKALEGRAAVLAMKSRPVLCCPAGSLRPLEVMKTAKVTVVPRGLIRGMPDQIIGNLRVGWPQRTFLISELQSPRPLLLELEGYLSSLQTDQPLGLYFR